MEADAMILIVDYKEYEGEERPVIMAFKHGLEEEKCWSSGNLVYKSNFYVSSSHPPPPFPTYSDDTCPRPDPWGFLNCFKTDLTHNNINRTDLNKDFIAQLKYISVAGSVDDIFSILG